EKNPYRLAVMASGSGSNAASFFSYFEQHPSIGVALVVTNNPDAYVVERARAAGIPVEVISGKMWKEPEKVTAIFDAYAINAIVLAGYMKLIPSFLVRRYPDRIFNIHPALLPDFGGKGMYGRHVHQAVLDAGAQKTGITIHLVNEQYDEGPVLFQKAIPVLPDDTPESLASRIQEMEHYHYPRVIEQALLENQQISSKYT
ncbi:MAG: phosphoribosylglycinamide formyltransferase, partial [Bacteroidota bacterium]